MRLHYLTGKIQSISQFLQLVETARSCGFDGVYVTDHIAPAWNGDPIPLDPWMLLGLLSALWPTGDHGLMAVCTPLTTPAHVKRSWDTYCLINQVMPTLGMGAGWLNEDFTLAGLNKAPLKARIHALSRFCIELDQMLGRSLIPAEKLVVCGASRDLSSISQEIQVRRNRWNLTPDVVAKDRVSSWHSTQALVYIDGPASAAVNYQEIEKHGLLIQSEKALQDWVNFLADVDVRTVLLPDFHFSDHATRKNLLRQVANAIRG